MGPYPTFDNNSLEPMHYFSLPLAHTMLPSSICPYGKQSTKPRGGPGKLDHLLRWLRPESERMRSHGKTKEFLSSV